MATFTRASIRKILGDSCTDEIENNLVALHLGVVDPLKDDLAKYRADAERLTEVQKELDALKAKGDGGYKEKFEKEHSEFEAYKKAIEEKEIITNKKQLYKALLKEAGVDEKRIDAILKVTDVSKMEIKDGKLDKAEELKNSIKTEWAGFIGKEITKGAGVDNPPENDNSGANPRAAQLAAQFAQQRYGVTPSENGGNRQ